MVLYWTTNNLLHVLAAEITRPCARRVQAPEARDANIAHRICVTYHWASIREERNQVINRRHFIRSATASAVALALTPVIGHAKSRWGRYDSSIIIDGLGFPGGMGTEAGTPLSALSKSSDIGASGLTATHLTLGPVGTMPTTEVLCANHQAISHSGTAKIAGNPECARRCWGRRRYRQRQEQNGRTGTDLRHAGWRRVRDRPVATECAMHGFGIRIVQPTYNRRNLLGDGCMEPANAGLSRAGHEAIERMNALGILVDLSHCGRQTTADAIAISSRPVAFTHTGCAALTDHPRHRTDDELRAVSQRPAA